MFSHKKNISGLHLHYTLAVALNRPRTINCNYFGSTATCNSF